MSIVIRGKSDLSSKDDDELAEIIISPGNNSLYESADYSPWFKSGPQPVFINKVLLEPNRAVYLLIICDCFCAMMTELSN